MKVASHLRRSTRDLHRQTEEAARGEQIRDYSLDLAHYRDLIGKNFFLHRHLEPLFLQALPAAGCDAFLPFIHPRFPALEQDAKLLGLSEPCYPVLLPTLSSKPQLLGGLYVFLGSNLGGRIIYQCLIDNPHLSDLSDFHFYRTAGAQPAAGWPRFCRLLDSYVREEELAEAVSGARAVFCLFGEVYLGSGTWESSQAIE